VRHQHAPARWVGLVVQGGASCTLNFPLLQTKADELLMTMTANVINVCRVSPHPVPFAARWHAVVMFSRAISSVESG